MNNNKLLEFDTPKNELVDVDEESEMFRKGDEEQVEGGKRSQENIALSVGASVGAAVNNSNIEQQLDESEDNESSITQQGRVNRNSSQADVNSSNVFLDKSQQHLNNEGGSPKSSKASVVEELTCDLAEAAFPSEAQTDSFVKTRLGNGFKYSVAFKVQCSDNNIYRVRPVFGTIVTQGVAVITISRLAFRAEKQDKLRILYKRVPDSMLIDDPTTPVKLMKGTNYANCLFLLISLIVK